MPRWGIAILLLACLAVVASGADADADAAAALIPPWIWPPTKAPTAPPAPPKAPPSKPPQEPPKAPPSRPPQEPPKAPPSRPPQEPPKAPPSRPPQEPPKAPPSRPPQEPPKAPPSKPPQEPPKAPPQEPPKAPPSKPPQYPPMQPPQEPPSKPPQEPPSKPPMQPPQYPPSKPPQEPPSKPPQYPPSKPPQEPPSKPPMKPPQYPPSKPPQEPPSKPPQYPPSKPPQEPPSKPPQYPPSKPPQEPPSKPPMKPPQYPPSKPPQEPPSKPPMKPPQYPPSKPPQEPPSKPPMKPPQYPPSKPPQEPPSKPPMKPPQYPPSKPPQEPPSKPPQYPPSKPPQEPPSKPPMKPPQYPPSKPPQEPPSKPPMKPPQYPPSKPPQEPPSKPPMKPPQYPPSKPPQEPPSKPPMKPPQYPPSKPPQEPPKAPPSKPPQAPPPPSKKPPPSPPGNWPCRACVPCEYHEGNFWDVLQKIHPEVAKRVEQQLGRPAHTMEEIVENAGDLAADLGRGDWPPPPSKPAGCDPGCKWSALPGWCEWACEGGTYNLLCQNDWCYCPSQPPSKPPQEPPKAPPSKPPQAPPSKPPQYPPSKPPQAPPSKPPQAPPCECPWLPYDPFQRFGVVVCGNIGKQTLPYGADFEGRFLALKDAWFAQFNAGGKCSTGVCGPSYNFTGTCGGCYNQYGGTIAAGGVESHDDLRLAGGATVAGSVVSTDGSVILMSGTSARKAYAKVLINDLTVTAGYGYVTTGTKVISSSLELSVNPYKVCDYFEKVSANLANFPANCGFTGSNGYLYLTVVAGMNVVRVTAAEFNAITNLRITGPKTATVVINVSGKTISPLDLNIVMAFFPKTADGVTAANVIVNFFEAETIVMTGAADYSVLAPYAEVTFTAGQVNGNLITKHLYSGGAYKDWTKSGSSGQVNCRPFIGECYCPCEPGNGTGKTTGKRFVSALGEHAAQESSRGNGWAYAVCSLMGVLVVVGAVVVKKRASAVPPRMSLTDVSPGAASVQMTPKTPNVSSPIQRRTFSNMGV